MIVALPALAGCAAGDDPANEDAMGETESAVSGTCAAARGRGVINRYQKALHDSLAFAEGTENDGKDGYDVLFTHRKFSSCGRHPNTRICSGGLCSTATGRYQFLKTTWDSVAAPATSNPRIRRRTPSTSSRRCAVRTSPRLRQTDQ